MRTPTFLAGVLSLSLLLGATGCLPYTVGSTAQTVPTSQTSSAGTWYFIPNAVRHDGDTLGIPLAGFDEEFRHGIDERSDIGFRITAGSGAVINYKHRFVDYGTGSPALAYMVGAGVVNFGEHLHFEGSLIASGDEQAAIMPYGGLRVMQVMPIASGAVNDSPTMGAFGGLQLGDPSFTIRPELGVFYDHSALGLRSRNVIFVPAVTFARGRRRDSREGADPFSHPPAIGDGTSAPVRRGGLRCLIVRCAPLASRADPRSVRGSTSALH